MNSKCFYGDRPFDVEKDSPYCDDRFFEPAPKPTLFDHITQSVEVLAPKLVYFDSSVCDDDGMGYPWCSTLFEDGGHFETEEKAISATIKELEKVIK